MNESGWLTPSGLISASACPEFSPFVLVAGRDGNRLFNTILEKQRMSEEWRRRVLYSFSRTGLISRPVAVIELFS